MFTIILFSILIIISGSIAYLGDKLGSTLGRARTSLFGIRPRYTARLIAILSGMLITATTIGIIAIFTEDGRILLAGVEKIRKELKSNEMQIKNQQESLMALNDEKIRLDEMVTDLEKQRDTLEKQIGEYKQLSANLADVRGKKLALSVGDVLLATNIDKNDGKSAKTITDELLNELNLSLSKHKTGFWTNSKQRFYLPDKDYSNLIDTIKKASAPLKIKFIAKSNVFEQEFAPIKVTTEQVRRLYSKNDTILTAKVASTTSDADLIKYLQDAKNIMLTRGLVIEANEQPYVDLTNFYAVGKDIKAMNTGTQARLEIYATDNIYSHGPATVNMRIIKN